MGVIGITLIVATLAIFIMYPSTWRALAQPFLQWRRPEAAEETPSPQTTTNTDDKPKAPLRNGTAPSKTEADRIAMPPPPPPPTIRMPVPEIVENGKTDEDEEEEAATTPKATPTIVQNGGSIPTLSLSADDEDDDDDTDNMPPPMFPSPYSAQRAGASADPSRRPAVPSMGAPTLTTTAPSAPPNPSFGLMAPPPRPAVNRGAAALAPVNAARRPANLPIPNRGPPTSLRAPTAGSSLAPPPSSTTKPAKPARKVVLAPGHSPLDWARVTSDPVGNRLRGNLPDDAPYLLRVTPSQLKQMNGRKGRDAWTVLGGMVYNITPYVPFHPGGAGELLRCAGKDGNQLFNDVHSWVNYDNMLSACRIGVMVEEHAATTSPMEEMD